MAAGVTYLEDNAASVRVGSSSTLGQARGLLAASYLHGTSRALDPELHCHVVVANMAEGPADALRPWWAAQLADVGFTERTLRRCYGRQADVPLVTAAEREALFALLDSP